MPTATGPRSRPFAQVDVFSPDACGGNPVAVVLDADGLDTPTMQRFASWTNLSETTFVLPPTAPGADYRVRIFTPSAELPFAGHPTLGTCHAWREAGGRTGAGDRSGDVVVQECAAGLVPVRPDGGRLAFAAPALVRSGPVDAATRDEALRALGLAPDEVVEVAWVDNGPGWVGVLLDDVHLLRELAPLASTLDIGVVAPCPPGDDAAIEVRAFFPVDGSLREDPVTGSLNASVAQWLLGSGRLAAPYVARQGAALGRTGRVHVDRDDDGTIWIGGATTTLVAGTVTL